MKNIFIKLTVENNLAVAVDYKRSFFVLAVLSLQIDSGGEGSSDEDGSTDGGSRGGN
jgi:hypothetical protein